MELFFFFFFFPPAFVSSGQGCQLAKKWHLRKPRTKSNFLKCIIYHKSNTNTKRQKAINQLINIPLIKLIDIIYRLSFTAPRIHYCYWLQSVLHGICLFSPRLATAAYNHFQRECESSSLEMVVSGKLGIVCFVSAAMAFQRSITPCQQPTLCLNGRLYWKLHLVYYKTKITLLHSKSCFLRGQHL